VAGLPPSVTIDPSLVTTTLPGRGQGIIVQSVGGGGGHGGMNVTGIITPQATRTATVGVGGSGGAGGDAGNVSVVRGATTAARLETWGDKSTGLLAQSIGGGGGDAGMNFVTNVGNLSAASDSYAMNVAFGGEAGDGGLGGTVSVATGGSIETSGNFANGFLAQSVGGGGGHAAINLAIPVTRKATAFDFALGGGPGSGGTGAQVTVQHSGTIGTEGSDSDAILVQSIGGGGGDTAFNLALDLISTRKVALSVGRSGGTGGNAGAVEVTSNGTLITRGERSSGITVQSIGGGGGRSGSITVVGSASGGAGADKFSNQGRVSVGLDGASGGIGGDVSVTASGRILTAGSEAFGIYAQSVGGGGGAGAMSVTIATSSTPLAVTSSP